MGYYTTYTLSTTQGHNNQEEIEEKLQQISGYSIEFGRNDPCKWYMHEQDMKELSKIYPETTFLLEGQGEESEDIWRKYFKNGKKSGYAKRRLYSLLLMNRNLFGRKLR